MRKLLLIAFFFITIKAFPQITPTLYWQFESATPYVPTVGPAANTITPNAASGYSVNSGGPVGKYLTTSISDFSTTAGTFLPTTAMSVQFIMRPGHDFSKLRNAQIMLNGQFSISYQYPSIVFTTSNGVEDRWQIDLEAVGKKTWKAFNDGNFHLFTFVYNAATGRKLIFIDAQCPSGFSKTLPIGSGTIFTSSPTLWFSTTVNYTQFAGDIDELQLFKGEISANQVYQNYTEFQAGSHFSNTLAASVPAPDPITAGYDATQYAPGYPSVTVTPIVQLQTFPGPRYKPIQTAADSLLPLSSCMDGIYLGGTFQSGISDAQAVLNGAEINLFLAQRYNWVLSAWGLGQGLFAADTTTFQGKIVKMAKANPKTKLEFCTFRPQLEPFDRVPFGSNQAAIMAYGYKPYYFLQNSSGQYLDENGNVTTSNRKGRPSATLAQSYSNLPDTVLLANGDTVKAAFQRVTTALGGLNTVFSVWENTEDYLVYLPGAMSLDPIVSANLAASGLTGRQFQGTWRGRNEVNYRDKFIATGTVAATNSTYYNLYQNQGNPFFFYDWNYLRNSHTTYRGKKLSTADMYFRDARSWFYNCHTSCADHGLSWFIQDRQEEFGAGDSLQYPFVSHGWSTDEYANMAPAPYLGLLKVMAAMGSESFKPSSFWVGGQYPNPKQMIWSAVYPAYAQAITTRYEKQLHYGKLLPGDMPADPSLPSGYAGYRYSAGDFRTFVAVRKDDLANKFVIAANHNRNSNMIGNNEDTVVRYITLAGEQLTFTVREQGSVYFYDNTNTSNKVFYQLDKWHERSYPYTWSTDFGFEAEVSDNYVPSQLKTDRAAGAAAGNYVNSTTYISYADTTVTLDTIRFNFQPRAAATYYVWIRMKSRTGAPTGVTINMNGGATKTLTVSNTNWFWYRYNGAAIPANIISYSLTVADQHLGVLPTNKLIEIDQIVLTQTPNAGYPETTSPCSIPSTITPSGATTFCTGSSVTLTALPATTYLWSTGASTQAIVVSTSGTFTVTITDASGCTGVSSGTTVTVNALPAVPTISASGPTGFCTGGSVTLTSSTGTTYLWSTGSTTASISPTTAASYRVTITNASGCTRSSNTLTVTVSALPGVPTITPTGATTFCIGGSVLLTATASTTYLWSTGQTSQAVTVSPSSATGYTVTVTNAAGCTRSSATTTVTVNPAPIIAPLTQQYANVCPAIDVDVSTITLTNTGQAISGKTYHATLSDATNNINPISSIVAANSTIYIRCNSANGCFDIVPVVVVINSCGCASPPASGAVCDNCTLSGSPLRFHICSGTAAQLNGSIANATVGTWATSGTGTFSPSTTTLNAIYTPSAADILSGLVTLSLTTNNPLGAPCVPNVTFMPLYIDPALSATITASGSTSICTGSTVGLVASSGIAYLWSTGATTQSIMAPSVSASYYCIVTVGTCTDTSNILTVLINSLPSTPSITAGGPSTFCSGGSVTLSSTGATSYLWSTGATTQSISSTTTNSYTVTVTNAAGCTASSAQFNTTVNAAPTTPVITTPSGTAICPGATMILTSTGASSYQWSTGGTLQSISIVASGTYTVTVTESGCTASATKVITSGIGPVAGITATPSATVCVGATVTLTSAPSGTYLWSTGATTQIITTITAGVFTCTVTNAGGCTAVSPPLGVTISAAIPTTVTVVGAVPVCYPGSVTLTAPAGYIYSWNTSATTQSITVGVAGSYYVVVSNGAGCSATSAIVLVTVSQIGTPSIYPASPVFICPPQNKELVATPAVSYLWSTGATTQNIIVSAAGLYSVTVTSALGCTKSSAATTVIEGSSLNPIITVSGGSGTVFCQGGSRTLTSSAATAYAWSTGATTQAISVSTAGSYRVTVTDAYGCTKSSAATTVTVKTSASTPVITVADSVRFCRNATVALSVPSSSGNSYLWSNAATVRAITLNATGTYTVTVTNSLGCSASASKGVTKDTTCTITCGTTRGVSIINVTSTKATVEWAQTNVNSRYRISVRPTRTGSRQIQTTDQDSLKRTATFTGLKPGETYYYYIVGYCGSVASDSSAAKIFTTPR